MNNVPWHLIPNRDGSKHKMQCRHLCDYARANLELELGNDSLAGKIANGETCLCKLKRSLGFGTMGQREDS